MDTLTAESQAFWTAIRHDGGAWTRHYWESASAPYRQELLDAVAPSAPFERVLEVGCNSGPNYRRFREAFGDFTYVGLDVNAIALAAAIEWIRREQVPGKASFQWGSILTDTRTLPDRAFDLVFSSACLAHIAPADISTALAEMLRLSDRIVAIQEPAETKHEGQFHQWAHDFRSLLSVHQSWVWVAHGAVWVGERHV